MKNFLAVYYDNLNEVTAHVTFLAPNMGAAKTIWLTALEEDDVEPELMLIVEVVGEVFQPPYKH